MFHEQRNLTLLAEAFDEPLSFRTNWTLGQDEDILNIDACALSDLIAARKLSCAEVATVYLDRIERTNPAYNAIVSMRDRDEILAEARDKDKLLARGIRQGWMHGFPLAIKDLAATKGLRTTQGSPIHRNTIPTRDAGFVARMKQSGAIVIGKTNTAEFGLGSQTYNPVFGTTLNAFDRTCTAGGSSGGAAVALATRMLPVADGSDNAGSIRNPAAFNNVYGLRPTQGLIPSEGRDICLPSLGTVGPMARNVDDLAMLLAVQAGHEGWSLASTRNSPASLREELKRDFRGARIGWLGDFDGYLAFQPGVLDLCEKAMQVFSDIGCVVEAVRVHHPLDELWNSWVTLRAWLTGGSLAGRFSDPAKRALMKEEARWEVEQALRLSAMDVLEASSQRAAWCRTMATLFETFDFLVLPTAQCFPFNANLTWPRTVGERRMDTYYRWMEVVIPATMAGCPAINVPAGFSTKGLPMGLQLLAPCDEDLSCLQLAWTYEHATSWNSVLPPNPVAIMENSRASNACSRRISNAPDVNMPAIRLDRVDEVIEQGALLFLALFSDMPRQPDDVRSWGGLSRSRQHFILEGKDGVWRWIRAFVEGLQRPRRQSYGIAGSAGSRSRRSVGRLVSRHRRFISRCHRTGVFVQLPASLADGADALGTG